MTSTETIKTARDMGQYFHPIIVTKKEKLEFNPHNFYEGLKLMEHSYFGVPMVEVIMQYLHDKETDKPHLVWMGDYGGPIDIEVNGEHQHIQFSNCVNYAPSIRYYNTYRYIINHDKEEYVDLVKCRENSDVHPLPLLTANGNGQGGGDYLGSDMDLVGSWAGDRIAVVDSLTGKAAKYTELKPNFKEEY